MTSWHFIADDLEDNLDTFTAEGIERFEDSLRKHAELERLFPEAAA